MAGFRGTKEVSLDAKWRMALPTRYRELAQAICNLDLILTVNPFNKCLTVYPINEWEAIETKLIAFPDAKTDLRNLRTLIMGYAVELELDSAGRFVIPPMHRKFAGIEKDVVLLGQVKKFEIWNGARLEEISDTWTSEELNSDKPRSPELDNLVL